MTKQPRAKRIRTGLYVLFGYLMKQEKKDGPWTLSKGGKDFGTFVFKRDAVGFIVEQRATGADQVADQGQVTKRERRTKSGELAAGRAPWSKS